MRVSTLSIEWPYKGRMYTLSTVRYKQIRHSGVIGHGIVVGDYMYFSYSTQNLKE